MENLRNEILEKFGRIAGNVTEMLKLAEQLNLYCDNWSIGILTGYFSTFSDEGQKLAHQLCKALRVKFDKRFDSCCAYYIYTATKNGIEITVISTSIKGCRIEKTERTIEARTETVYESVCGKE